MVRSIADSSLSDGTVLDLTGRELVRVLHVDDDLVFLEFARRYLEIEGKFQVDAALSVDEAVERMKRERYDAIISDCVMLGRDGLEFLKELRNSGNNIPFVMFTGKSIEEAAIKALNLGADGYFSKADSPETVYRELAQRISQTVERRRAEEALRENGSYLKTVLDSMFTGFLVIDEATHRIVDANSHALETIGASGDDVIGRICHSFICPAENGKCPVTDLGQTVDRSEHVLLRADGVKVPILKTVKPITRRGHTYLAESFVEISKGKKRERTIQESQENFKQLFMGNPEATVYMDSGFHILDVNPRFAELFGYAPDEVRGKHIDDAVVPEIKAGEGELLDRKALKGYVNYDTVRKRKDGSLVQVSVSGGPITVKSRTIGYLGVYRDITERKRYEERLSALNSFSRSVNLAESMEEIYRLTMDAVEKTLGFEIAFFMVADRDILRVVDHRGYPEAFSVRLPLNGTKKGVSVKAAKTGKSINVPDAEKDDDWVEFMPGIRSAVDVPVKIGSKVLGVIGADSKELNAFSEKDQELLEILASHAATAMSNLHHAKSLEAYAEEIRESQQRFERLFMDNPEAAVHTDSGFRVLNVNPRFTRLFGYHLDEIKGKRINDVIVPENKMKEATAIDERACKGETYHEDTFRKRKDGSLVPVALSTSPIMAENQAIGHIAVYKDISQLKKVEEELRQTLEQLARMNEKLRVIGGLTRHDARNKLAAITGNLYLAKKKLDGNTEISDNLKGIEAAVEQMVRIFDFAKTYEMLGAEEMRNVDVDRIVNEAASFFPDSKGAKVVSKCRGLTVLADSLLRQLFYNLIDNSLKYGEKTKTITVHYEETDNDELNLVYEDDGIGIAESEKKKLFQEGHGKGTGYGLYLIRKMCEGYGWKIQETGKEGIGARFTITIPRIGEKEKMNYNITHQQPSEHKTRTETCFNGTVISSRTHSSNQSQSHKR